MSLASPSASRRALHPLHVLLLVGAACYVVSGLLSDWLYFQTHEIQWKNFASWLIMGGLIFGAFALLWALVDLMRQPPPLHAAHAAYPGLLLAAWVLGFINELVHAKDAWASMPDALILSAIAALLMIPATWLGLSTIRLAPLSHTPLTQAGR